MVSNWFDGLNTERQRKFCEEFAQNGGNALAAARAAGYANPEAHSARLVENDRVKAALESLRKDTTCAAIATREERQAFWTSVLRGDVTDGEGLPPKFSDRLKASELLGRSQADFIERLRHEGEDGKPLHVRVEVVAPEKK
jgi:phage terminase small subunit